MERFENAIFRQRVEINDRMTKIFGLLKELTTSRAPEKVLIIVGIKSPITKNVNSTSLTKEEEERNYDNDIVIDIKENKKTPFIYETPILTTAKAVIKFDKGTITLRFGKTPTMTINSLVLEWEEKIKLHQEKEMKFDHWRNKNFKNERPDPVKIKDEMDDEGEVT
nr:hypothetical protein [Tanacetum cinerariifolium]